MLLLPPPSQQPCDRRIVPIRMPHLTGRHDLRRSFGRILWISRHKMLAHTEAYAILARQAAAGSSETSSRSAARPSERYLNPISVPFAGCGGDGSAVSESMGLRHLDLLWVARDLNLRWAAQSHSPLQQPATQRISGDDHGDFYPR
jgi:hypothetical protein